MALKDVPQRFKIDSEEDLRNAIADYFRELGFGVDEIQFETQFEIRLGHATIQIPRRNPKSKKARGRSDILLTFDRRPLAILETKSPRQKLQTEDAEQAISYARLLRQMAPYAIVTNGHETWVYDTLSENLTPLNDPTDSLWSKNGCQLPQISEELSNLAARTLIGINLETLTIFCKNQMKSSFADLKGNAVESKQYTTETYLPREEIVNLFDQWLVSEMSCFAVVGESGSGKTNFMCATAEQISDRFLVLYYSASRLYQGLCEAIRNDFIWEFHYDRNIAQIIERLDTIATKHARRIVIFVDGLDEYPDNLNKFRLELLDFVSRLANRNIRFCLSCKTFDWAKFIIENNQSYNQLALSIFPERSEVHTPQSLSTPDPLQIGVSLSQFSSDELERAFVLYQRAYTLQGELKGQLRTECAFPLMLRLIAEAYYRNSVELPDQITSLQVFNLYWDRKILQATDSIIARRLLAKIAEEMIRSGQKQISLDDLGDELKDPRTADCLRSLIRCGLLRAVTTGQEIDEIGFRFEELRNFVFTVKSRSWDKKEPKQVASEIKELIYTNLGLEAISFYFSKVDRGETTTLLELSLLDLYDFVHLIENINSDSSLEHLEADDLQQSLGHRLVEYANTYSIISRTYFRELCDRIEPNIPGKFGLNEVGVWVHGNIYQFRLRTHACPQPLIILSDDIFLQLRKNELSVRDYVNILPGGMMYMGLDLIVRQIPQAFAWSKLISQIGDLIGDRFLDETSVPLLLEERVFDILKWQPHLWLAGEPRQRYGEVLGCVDIRSA